MCAAPCARTPVFLGRSSGGVGCRALRRSNASRKSAAPKLSKNRRIGAVRAESSVDVPESELEEGEILGVRGVVHVGANPVPRTKHANPFARRARPTHPNTPRTIAFVKRVSSPACPKLTIFPPQIHPHRSKATAAFPPSPPRLCSTPCTSPRT